MRDYMERRVAPPKRVTSPTWGLSSPCKRALFPFVCFFCFVRAFSFKVILESLKPFFL